MDPPGASGPNAARAGVTLQSCGTVAATVPLTVRVPVFVTVTRTGTSEPARPVPASTLARSGAAGVAARVSSSTSASRAGAASAIR